MQRNNQKTFNDQGIQLMGKFYGLTDEAIDKLRDRDFISTLLTEVVQRQLSLQADEFGNFELSEKQISENRIRYFYDSETLSVSILAYFEEKSAFIDILNTTGKPHFVLRKGLKFISENLGEPRGNYTIIYRS